MPVESDDELRGILEHDTIAVVGCSTTSGKAAHDIPKYLQNHGYTVVPINPFADEILGEQAYDSLDDAPGGIDIVDDTLDRDDVKVVWTQLGIEDDEAARRAEDAGLRVVQDRCLKVEHGRLT